MNPIQRDLQQLRQVRQRMADEGVRPVLQRLIRAALVRIRIELSLLIRQALPITLGAAAVLGLIAFVAGLPFNAGLVLGGLAIIVFGVMQAGGAHGAVGAGPHGSGRNVPRMYQYMEPSWAATDDPDEQRRLWRERRQQSLTLFVKLLAAGILLILAGIAITAVTSVIN